jgi:hypothetical protein
MPALDPVTPALGAQRHLSADDPLEGRTSCSHGHLEENRPPAI